MSEIRRSYLIRLVLRCVILLCCVGLLLFRPEQFSVLERGEFFSRFSLLHLLWGVWLADMILQIFPIRNKLPLGSMKLFANRFRPIREKINYQALHDHVVTTTKAAYQVMLLWCALLLVIGVLYWLGVLTKPMVFLCSVIFYVCDLICVLIWCPFRLILKNRCCTTCRIFNWDHLMMFSPLLFIGGFYALSLAGTAILAWLVWELCVMMYPERFWDKSNLALQCSECTDRLCTQYCQKLRR
ncbi:MAG: hypothetical protein E7458_04125 [Ruminococcaceae bacterium]|nr:hypothetical protein [Oscillospiraceae bacterium]